jgi:uncharacterized protein
MNIKPKRIELVDALRGFAIMAIILLHNMERYEVYYAPPYFPVWLSKLDASLMESAYFLFGGKAYAIFALLFGFSFYAQNESQKQKGKSFGVRFLWRMVLLLLFGIFNTAFYSGDILKLYAVLGLILIPASYLSNRNLFVLALFFMLQPVEWFRVLCMTLHPNYVPEPNASMAYYEQMSNYMLRGGFREYLVGNLTVGKTASYLWSWENGRFLQAPALFLLGMWAARKKLFVTTEATLLFWKKILSIALLSFVLLYGFTSFLPTIITRTSLLNSLKIIFSSWSNFALMLFWVGLFVLLYSKQKFALNKLIPIGKMGLTCYIMQSIIGSTIYYKYGFGWYQYTGASYGFLLGILLFILQLQFCKWWLQNHMQGPLESLWSKLTWIKI